MIVLPFPPAKLSGHHEDNRNIYGKAALIKEWRTLAWAKAMSLTLPEFPKASAYTPEGDIPLLVKFYPPDRRGDRVNFPNRCKPIFDGLADALKVNDARFVPQFEFHAPEKPGRVEIYLLNQSKGEGL